MLSSKSLPSVKQWPSQSSRCWKPGNYGYLKSERMRMAVEKALPHNLASPHSDWGVVQPLLGGSTPATS